MLDFLIKYYYRSSPKGHFIWRYQRLVKILNYHRFPSMLLVEVRAAINVSQIIQICNKIYYVLMNHKRILVWFIVSFNCVDF